jgi:hypothetical protein
MIPCLGLSLPVLFEGSALFLAIVPLSATVIPAAPAVRLKHTMYERTR